MSILQDILGATASEVSARRAMRPLAELRKMVADAPKARSLRDALSTPFSVIAEVKAKSPSAGPMDPRNVERAPKVYENTPSVSAISVLTQEKYFGGSLDRLWEIRQFVTKPILRKDFIFDDYQVIEARAFGADAILLMATLFVGRPDGAKRLSDLYDLSASLGMDALVEIGMSDAQPEQLASIVPEKAMVWGINSRHFHGTPFKIRTTLGRVVGRDFTTVATRHERLRELIPEGRIAVAESGIHKPADLRRLKDQKYQAALIGTALLQKGSIVEDAVSGFAFSAEQLRKR